MSKIKEIYLMYFCSFWLEKLLISHYYRHILTKYIRFDKMKKQYNEKKKCKPDLQSK